MEHDNRATGSIKNSADDFIVDEVPLYEPSGVGSHLYVRFRKRGLTTDFVVRGFAQALGVSARDIGVAGLKDKIAVTTQTISIPVPPREPAGDFEQRVRSVAIDGVDILDARLHANKLKTGHLTGNRFDLVIRDIAPTDIARVVARFEEIARDGVPNAFGEQRFGMRGDNADVALKWLRDGGPGPRDARQRRFLWSALQSAIFNDVLDRRVADGTWHRAIAGDLLVKHDSGAVFLCADESVDSERAARGEVSATGPMAGVDMRKPEGAPHAIEEAVEQKYLGPTFDWAATRTLGAGARRPLRLWVKEVEASANTYSGPEGGDSPIIGASMRVKFMLPKGGYATTVLSSVLRIVEANDSA